MKRILLSPDATRLGDVLKESLSSADWGTFRAAIAFVKYSGVKHIYDELKQFVQNKSVKISVGVDTGEHLTMVLVDYSLLLTIKVKFGFSIIKLPRHSIQKFICSLIMRKPLLL